MKKVLLGLAFLTCMNAFAQDTTSSRLLISGTYPANIYFTENAGGLSEFASVLPDGMSLFNSTSQGLFMHPDNYRLYALLDTGGFAERSIYEVNPLTGENTMVYGLGDLFASVEITDSGRVFGIHGNGGGTPGAVFEVDIFNQTSSMVFQSSVPFGNPRALGFDPTSQQLMVLTGYIDSLYTYDMNTWTETALDADLGGEEIHGTYYRDDTLWVSTYSGDVGFIDLANSYDVVQYTGVTDAAMDLCEIKLVDAPASVSLCTGEYLSALYESNSYAWYVDGVMVPNSDSIAIEITASGMYELVTQIADSTAYIRSESINVTLLNSPSVSITPQDTLICEGDTVALMASMGGTSQWFMDGSAIAGATSNIYMATMPGSYNMQKTNTNGCSDTADVAATIGFLPADSCNATGISTVNDRAVTLFPNPTSGILEVSSQGKIHNIVVRDIAGKVVIRQYENGTQLTRVDLLSLQSGMYLIEVSSESGLTRERVLKL